MKTKVIEVDHHIGDRVRMGDSPQAKVGTVRCITIAQNTEYEVGWWDDAEYRRGWFLGQDLHRVTDDELKM